MILNQKNRQDFRGAICKLHNVRWARVGTNRWPSLGVYHAFSHVEYGKGSVLWVEGVLRTMQAVAILLHLPILEQRPN